MEINQDNKLEENYYTLLGTRSNASPELIRTRYFEKLRQFPPEEDPEQFKKIRKAYDVLKDPFSRSKYNLRTKYQGRIENYLEKASFLMDVKQYKMANELLEEALKLDKENIFTYIILARSHYYLGKKALMEKTFNLLEEKLPVSEKIVSYLQHAVLYFEEKKYAEALKIAQKGLAKFPRQEKHMVNFLAGCYAKLEKGEKACSVYRDFINNNTLNSIDDYNYFFYYLKVVDLIEEFNKIEEVKEAFSSFINSFPLKQDREIIYQMLKDDYEEHKDIAFIVAKVCLELYAQGNPQQDFTEEIKFLDQNISFNYELLKIREDHQIFPLVSMQAYKFVEQKSDPFFDEEDFDEFSKSQLGDMIHHFENDHESYILGVYLLKEKYPGLYNSFAEEWEKLVAEKEQLLPKKRRNISPLKQSANYDRQEDGILVKKGKKVGRNDPCPCGSGKKYKKCCL